MEELPSISTARSLGKVRLLTLGARVIPLAKWIAPDPEENVSVPTVYSVPFNVVVPLPLFARVRVVGLVEAGEVTDPI